MRWTKTSTKTDTAKTKKDTKARNRKVADDQTEANLQSTAKDSRTHFHKSSNNNKNNIN